MIDWLAEAIENGFDVLGDLFIDGEIDKTKVSKLIADGVSIATIAMATGWTVEQLEKVIEVEE